jgi:hypothetical protein
MAYPTFSYNGSSVTLPFPSSLETDITLPFDTVNLDDATIDIYDHGEQYDKRITKISFHLTTTQQSNFNTFLISTARAKEVQFSPGNSGIHIFGPDKGDTNSFDVTCVFSGTPKIGFFPFRYFLCELIVTNTGSFPAYSLPSEIDDGPFTIGDVTNLFMPQRGFEPNQTYTISVSHTENSTPQIFDRGSDGDSVFVKLLIPCNETKAAALLYYLTHTIRAQVFQITAQTYYYIFGMDHGGSGSYYVQLSSPKINVKMLDYNNWQVSFQLKKVDAP